MKIFNRDGFGAEEIVAAVGLIARGISFDKWEPLLPLGMRDVTAVIGRGPVEALAAYYETGECEAGETRDEMEAALGYLQQSVALFTWLKLIPTLDAQHDDTGRSRRLGENEKGLTALQEFKDEENILRLAYESLDALVEVLDDAGFRFWVESEKFRMRDGLLIRSVGDFDDYYFIGSHRLFVTLLPVLREVQGSQLAPVLGKWLDPLLAGDRGVESMLGEQSRRALALLTMQKAIERLPVEVIPEGVVQVQQSAPIKSRLRAEQSARQSVAASLYRDASRILDSIQQTVAGLENPDSGETPERPSFIKHSKGFSF